MPVIPAFGGNAGGLKFQRYPQLYIKFETSLRQMKLSLDIGLFITWFACFCIYLFMVGIEPKTLHILILTSTTKMFIQPLSVLFKRVGLSVNLLFRLASWYR